MYTYRARAIAIKFKPRDYVGPAMAMGTGLGAVLGLIVGSMTGDAGQWTGLGIVLGVTVGFLIGAGLSRYYPTN